MTRRIPDKGALSYSGNPVKMAYSSSLPFKVSFREDVALFLTSGAADLCALSYSLTALRLIPDRIKKILVVPANHLAGLDGYADTDDSRLRRPMGKETVSNAEVVADCIESGHRVRMFYDETGSFDDLADIKREQYRLLAAGDSLKGNVLGFSKCETSMFSPSFVPETLTRKSIDEIRSWQRMRIVAEYAHLMYENSLSASSWGACSSCAEFDKLEEALADSRRCFTAFGAGYVRYPLDEKIEAEAVRNAKRINKVFRDEVEFARCCLLLPLSDSLCGLSDRLCRIISVKDDVMTIWRSSLEESGFPFYDSERMLSPWDRITGSSTNSRGYESYRKMRISAEDMRSFAELIGADNYLRAYSRGVPITDLIEMR